MTIQILQQRKFMKTGKMQDGLVSQKTRMRVGLKKKKEKRKE
jgi:hypothetical protein